MPNLKITGLAQETDFADPTKTVVVAIIDNGALRLRIDEASVQDLLRYALGDSTGETVAAQTNGHSEDEGSGSHPDDADENATPPADDDDGPTDEAGVAQI